MFSRIYLLVHQIPTCASHADIIICRSNSQVGSLMQLKHSGWPLHRSIWHLPHREREYYNSHVKAANTSLVSQRGKGESHACHIILTTLLNKCTFLLVPSKLAQSISRLLINAVSLVFAMVVKTNKSRR